MGWSQDIGGFRILPIGLVLGVFGCAGTNQGVAWQQPKTPGPISRLLSSKNGKPETTATIVAIPEPGQAVSPNSIIANPPPNVSIPGVNPKMGGVVASVESTANPNTAPSQQPPAPLSQAPVSPKVSRFFPLFNRHASVTPSRIPTPETVAAAAASAGAAAEEPVGESDLWAETARPRALALLESDRVKARLKYKNYRRPGTADLMVKADGGSSNDQNSVLPVALEINTTADAKRAAVARSVDRVGTNTNRALGQAREPRPDPYRPYPSEDQLAGTKAGVVLEPPTELVDNSEKPAAPAVAESSVKTPEHPDDAMAAEAPDVAAAPPVVIDQAPSESEAKPVVAVAEPAVDEAAPVVVDAAPSSELAATKPDDMTSPASPAALPQVEVAPVPEVQPVSTSAATSAPAAGEISSVTPSNPTEQPALATAEVPQLPPSPTMGDVDQIHLPTEIDAASETRVAEKVERATERASHSEPVLIAGDVTAPTQPVALSDESTTEEQVPPPRPKTGTAPTASTPKTDSATSVPAPKPADMPSATEPPKAADIPKAADTPPLPAPAPEAKPADPDTEEKPPAEVPKEPAPAPATDDKASVTPAPKADEKEDKAPADKPKDEPKPEKAAPAAPSPTSQIVAVPSVTTTPAVPSKRRLDLPRWVTKTMPAAQGPTPSNALKAPSKIAPATVPAQPQAVSKALPKAVAATQAPSKTLPTADPRSNPKRIPIWSPYTNNLTPYVDSGLAAPTKSRPSESPTAGWKVPAPKQSAGAPSKTAPVATAPRAPRKFFPSLQAALATANQAAGQINRPKVAVNRETLAGAYDFNEFFPATYQSAMTKVTPLDPNAQVASTAPTRVEIAPVTTAERPKRKSLIARFLSSFRRDDDDSSVPTPADAVAGRVNPRGLWIDRPEQPTSIAAEPGDVPQGGEGVERVSTNRLDEPPQR